MSSVNLFSKPQLDEISCSFICTEPNEFFARVQVENLTRKAQHQEVELDRTTKQLKEAIAIASEETAKCKAAKEVIKSLTAQVESLTPRATFKNYIPTTATSSHIIRKQNSKEPKKKTFSYWVCTHVEDW